jgi:hypothetical protein
LYVPARESRGWIVLAVGIATVAAQVYAAPKGAGVAREQVEASKKQVAASEAVLRNESAAVLVVSRGPWATEQATLHVQNGGRFPAIDLRLECLDENGQPITSGRVPVVQPGADEAVGFPLGSVETQDRFARANQVRARWGDGLGPREMKLTVLGEE